MVSQKVFYTIVHTSNSGEAESYDTDLAEERKCNVEDIIKEVYGYRNGLFDVYSNTNGYIGSYYGDFFNKRYMPITDEMATVFEELEDSKQEIVGNYSGLATNKRNRVENAIKVYMVDYFINSLFCDVSYKQMEEINVFKKIAINKLSISNSSYWLERSVDRIMVEILREKIKGCDYNTEMNHPQLKERSL